MSLPEDGNKMGALKREWAAARIVVIGGFVVAIAIAGYFFYQARQAQIAQQPVVHATVVRPNVDTKNLARVELAVCSAELLRAKDLGIVPNYADLATGSLVRAPDAPHRFICEARTHFTDYFISADVLCDKIADPRCVSVYRIATKDRQLIYARPEE